MGTDPIEARRHIVLRMADHLALQVSSLAQADAWWDHDESRVELAARIRARTEAARAAIADAEHALTHERNASGDAESSLVAVKAWASECRRRLFQVGPHAAREVAAVRDSLACDLRRLTGTISMLRAAIWELEQQRPALESEMPVGSLVERARAHLAVLEDHARATDQAAAGRLAATTAAATAIDDLRDVLRYTRLVWSVVVACSEGAVAPLDWRIGKAEVQARRARQTADEQEDRSDA